MDTLKCTKCGTVKLDTEFHRAPLNVNRRQRTCWCKLCANEQNRDRKRLQRAAGTEPGKQGAAYHRDYSLRKKYGLDSAAVDAMLAEQGGCAICRSVVPKHKRGWAVDHDHDTGAVRAILCNPCNSGIGYLGDDADRVMAAAFYLAEHKSKV